MLRLSDESSMIYFIVWEVQRDKGGQRGGKKEGGGVKGSKGLLLPSCLWRL